MGEATSSEVNGFVSWLASFAAFFAYCCWALCSTEQLENLGVTYYPDRYWVLALPIMLLVVLAIVFFGYAFINILYSPSPESTKQFVDERAVPPTALAEEAVQLMAVASAAAMAAAAAEAAAKQQAPQHLNCQDNLQAPILRRVQQEALRPRPRRRGALGDLPLSLVSRVLFPINPNLEGRCCGVEGPPFYYYPLRPAPPR